MAEEAISGRDCIYLGYVFLIGSKRRHTLSLCDWSTDVYSSDLLPKSDGFQAANFGGLIPTESWSFSSEKSYSPSRLICCQDTTEPFAMVWNRIPRAFAAPRRCPALLLRGRMPWTILRV